MTGAAGDPPQADARHIDQDGRWRRSRGVPLPTQRERLEAAVEAALAFVEGAVLELDLLDGDPDLEPACEDEGAQCEDEGTGDDREPDQDGDGMVESSWQIGGRDVHLIDGADRSWAERCGHHGHASASRGGHDAHTSGRCLHDGGGWPSSGDCHNGNTSGHPSSKGTHNLSTLISNEGHLDPDEAPDPLQPPRLGYGCVR